MTASVRAGASVSASVSGVTLYTGFTSTGAFAASVSVSESVSFSVFCSAASVSACFASDFSSTAFSVLSDSVRASVSV